MTNSLTPNRTTSIPLSSSYSIPKIGLGTWKSKSGGEVKEAVKTAISVGYRHIDCAFAYGNEAEVGEALHDAIHVDKIVTREELFITGKLWNTFHKPEVVKNAIKYSLKLLKIDYFDLVLIHWPIDFAYRWDSLEETEFLGGEKNHIFPKIFDEKDPHYGKPELDFIEKIDTWKALENCVLGDEKIVRSIGLSNFNEKQIENLLQNPKGIKVKPAVLQIEVS